MKAVFVTKTFDEINKTPGEVSCLETEKPRIIAEDDILIKVAYASICGSDAHYIRDNLFTEMFPDVPFPVGHELSGVIEDLGPEAERLGFTKGDHVTGNFVLECGHCDFCRIGERQFCKNPIVNGSGQAEYIVWKAGQVFKLDKNIPLDEAALFEPFNISVGAMQISGFKSSDSVFVLGAGSIGQMLIQLLKKSGASFVGTSVRTQTKREVAEIMGADLVIDPINQNLLSEAKQSINWPGYDVVFESSGNVECAKQALDLVRPGGTIVLVSYYPPNTKLSISLFEQVVSKGITIKGLQIAQNSWIHSMKLFPLMNLKPLISKIYALEDCKKAYDDVVSGKCLKVLFKAEDN